VPRRALINPRTQQTDLLRRKALSFAGHDTVRIESLHKFDQMALLAFAGNDGRAGLAAFQQRLAAFNAQVALGASAAMALDAARFENGFDFLREINFPGG